MSSTTLKEAVDYWASESPDEDKIVRIVAEHGTYSNSELVQHEYNGILFYCDPGTPEKAISLIQDFINQYKPIVKECFANSIELHRFNSDFRYIEGVTASKETKGVYDHAWNSYEGYTIDVTRTASERYGAVFPNNIVDSAIPKLEEENCWSITENNRIDVEKSDFSKET